MKIIYKIKCLIRKKRKVRKRKSIDNKAKIFRLGVVQGMQLFVIFEKLGMQQLQRGQK